MVRCGRLRKNLDASELLTQPVQGGMGRVSVTAAQQQRGSRGPSRILIVVEPAPQLVGAGVVFFLIGVADQGA
jgi:hypothetical protein